MATTAVARTNEQPRVRGKGQSGRNYEFLLYPWATSFRAVGAVYVVLRHASPSYEVIYVGQTGDLSERFDDHHHAVGFSRRKVTHIAILLNGERRERREIESDLVAYYQPSLNQTSHG